MVFVFSDGVTPSYGVVLLAELALQLLLEVLFMVNTILARPKKVNKALKALNKESDKYKAKDVGTQPDVSYSFRVCKIDFVAIA